MVLSRKELGGRIKEARSIKGLKIGSKYTQQMLAEAIGISRSYLGDIEAGRRYPSYVLLDRISNACEVPFNFFDEDYSDKGEKAFTARENQASYSVENSILEIVSRPEDLAKLDRVTLIRLQAYISAVLDFANNEELTHEDLLKINKFKDFLLSQKYGGR